MVGITGSIIGTFNEFEITTILKGLYIVDTGGVFTGLRPVSAE